MRFKLTPFESLGMLQSGMTREESRQCAISGYKEFLKTTFSAVATDSFLGMDLHVYYSPDLTIKGVELFLPNQLTYQEMDFLGLPQDKIENDLKSRSINYSIAYGDIEIPDLGLSLNCNDDKIESAYISLVP